jgi:carbon-monoxide dehydrogenase small subunit
LAAIQTEGIKLKTLIELKINGQSYELAIDTHRTLLEVLREQLGFTGTKSGCDQGECGTCTVLMDGVPVHSCLTLAVDVRGKEITTIEGLARGKELHPLQQAFVDHGAIQCGFCTPGMVLTGKALLDKNTSPTEGEIRRAISGNLCRCTGYVKIVEAIQAAADDNPK